jgi:hypothetical protein
MPLQWRRKEFEQPGNKVTFVYGTGQRGTELVIFLETPSGTMSSQIDEQQARELVTWLQMYVSKEQEGK